VEGKGVLGVRALEEGRNGGAGGKNQSRCCAGGGGDEGSGSRGISGISEKRGGGCCGRVGGMSEFVRAWLAVGFREMIRPCHIDLFNFSLYYPNRIN